MPILWLLPSCVPTLLTENDATDVLQGLTDRLGEIPAESGEASVDGGTRSWTIDGNSWLGFLRLNEAATPGGRSVTGDISFSGPFEQLGGAAPRTEATYRWEGVLDVGGKNTLDLDGWTLLRTTEGLVACSGSITTDDGRTYNVVDGDEGCMAEP